MVVLCSRVRPYSLPGRDRFLSRGGTAYNKENFYRGIRILLELQRQGSSKLRRYRLFQVFIDRLGHLKHIHLFRAKVFCLD
jgi:hypothetical protein